MLVLRLLVVLHMLIELLPLFKPLSKALASTDLTKSDDAVSEPDNVVKLAMESHHQDKLPRGVRHCHDLVLIPG